MARRGWSTDERLASMRSPRRRGPGRRRRVETVGAWSILLARVYRPRNGTGTRMVPGARPRSTRGALADLLVRELGDQLEGAIGRRRAGLAHDEALALALE